jgi:hypothetical protein
LWQGVPTMCFSAEADLATGVMVSAIGIDAVRHARTPRELPLAALPLVFGAHQLVEVLVWWGLAGKVSASLSDVATWVYLAIAFALPFWVPVAVRGVEPDRRRRTAITLFAAVGLVVTIVLLGSLVRGPVDASIQSHHIAYVLGIPAGAAISMLYVVATCGALLTASDRWIRSFGVANLIAVVVLVWLTVDGFASLWCVWAAVTSIAIDRYLRDEGRDVGVVSDPITGG